MTKVQEFLLYVSDLCKLALDSNDKAVILVWSRLVWESYLNGKLSENELVTRFNLLMATDRSKA